MPNHPPILVAEDEHTDAIILRMAAQRAGLSNPLFVVSDGVEVVDYLEGTGQYADRARHPLPALLLLDLKMPRMTGFDVLSWLAANQQLKQLPVVILSSSADESDMLKAKQLGAADYFVKPSHLADLVAILKRLDLRWLSEAPPAQPPTTPPTSA